MGEKKYSLNVGESILVSTDSLLAFGAYDGIIVHGMLELQSCGKPFCYEDDGKTWVVMPFAELYATYFPFVSEYTLRKALIFFVDRKLMEERRFTLAGTKRKANGYWVNAEKVSEYALEYKQETYPKILEELKHFYSLE